MANPRENPQVAEEFHEETPAEFAAQPDRAFTKVRAPSSEGPPEKESDEKDQGEGEATAEE